MESEAMINSHARHKEQNKKKNRTERMSGARVGCAAPTTAADREFSWPEREECFRVCGWPCPSCARLAPAAPPITAHAPPQLRFHASFYHVFLTCLPASPKTLWLMNSLHNQERKVTSCEASNPNVTDPLVVYSRFSRFLFFLQTLPRSVIRVGKNVS